MSRQGCRRYHLPRRPHLHPPEPGACQDGRTSVVAVGCGVRRGGGLIHSRGGGPLPWRSRPVMILRIWAGSVMTAITDIRLPQRGQAMTSSSCTLASSRAQALRRQSASTSRSFVALGSAGGRSCAGGRVHGAGRWAGCPEWAGAAATNATHTDNAGSVDAAFSLDVEVVVEVRFRQRQLHPGPIIERRASRVVEHQDLVPGPLVGRRAVPQMHAHQTVRPPDQSKSAM